MDKLFFFGDYISKPAELNFTRPLVYKDLATHTLVSKSSWSGEDIKEMLLDVEKHIGKEPDHEAFAEALHTSYTTYLKTERGNREPSFLTSLKICQFYKLELHEFISMLGDEELERNDFSVILAREKEKREKRKEESRK